MLDYCPFCHNKIEYDKKNHVRSCSGCDYAISESVYAGFYVFEKLEMVKETLGINNIFNNENPDGSDNEEQEKLSPLQLMSYKYKSAPQILKTILGVLIALLTACVLAGV